MLEYYVLTKQMMILKTSQLKDNGYTNILVSKMPKAEYDNNIPIYINGKYQRSTEIDKEINLPALDEWSWWFGENVANKVIDNFIKDINLSMKYQRN
jgi:hypothetical protein